MNLNIFYETEDKKQQTNQFSDAAEQQSLPDSLVKNHLKLDIDSHVHFLCHDLLIILRMQRGCLLAV